jgi:hypothetical protein
MRVSIFKNILCGVPQETSLEQIFHIIKSSEKLRELTEKARSYSSKGDRESLSKMKRNRFPAFAPAATMLGGKGRENLVTLTGICFFDIDHLSDKQMAEIENVLREDEHVLMLSHSVSGQGLHILVKYSLKHDDYFQIVLTPKRMNVIYGSVFKSLAKHYKGLLGVTIDKSGINAERLCLVSYDEDIYINYSPKPFVLKYETQQSGHYPKLFEILSV